MLGHLRMNVSQTIDALLDITGALFLENSDKLIDRESSSLCLKETIESIIQARGIDLDIKMNDNRYTAKRTKVYALSVFSSLCLMYLAEPYTRQHQLTLHILISFVHIHLVDPL